MVCMGHTENDMDKAILLRLKGGCQESFEQLFRKYSPRLYNFAYSILFDQSLAEDITQECFLKIWELRSNIDPEKNFRAYLYTIARNLVYKETERRIRADKVISLEERDGPAINNAIEEQIDVRFYRSYLHKMIEQLPPARKKIFILSRAYGLSYKDIAAKLAISEKTVETQITRALSHLRKCMGNYLTATLLYLLGNNL